MTSGIWQVALMSVVLYAIATLALVTWQFDETLTQPNPRALHFPTMMRIWWQVLSHPTFRAFALLSLAAYGALFVYLATSAFVFMQVLHLSGLQLGWILSSMSIMYITHDLGVIAEIADEVNVMYLGRVVERSIATELFAVTLLRVIINPGGHAHQRTSRSRAA